MSLHFERVELGLRIKKLRELMDENELDGMLLFSPGKHVLFERL